MQTDEEQNNYPVLKEMSVIELARLRLEAKRYEKEDPGFLKAIDLELKRRQNENR